MALESPVPQPTHTQLVAVARTRLRTELAALPATDSAALLPWLLRTQAPMASHGALVHHIRRACAQGRAGEAEQIFLCLMERIAPLNGKWVGQTEARVRVLPLAGAVRLREDLAQELAAHLWQEIVLRSKDAWELFFARSLKFAQQHVEERYLRREGYRSPQPTRLPERSVTMLLSSLMGDAAEHAALELPDARADLSAADLCDLRTLVGTLPERECTAVVMRFWLQQPDAATAQALGVSTRTVRNLLHSAYDRLRTAYSGPTPGDPS